jgi:hypothetical protein
MFEGHKAVAHRTQEGGYKSGRGVGQTGMVQGKAQGGHKKAGSLGGMQGRGLEVTGCRTESPVEVGVVGSTLGQVGVGVGSKQVVEAGKLAQVEEVGEDKLEQGAVAVGSKANTSEGQSKWGPGSGE